MRNIYKICDVISNVVRLCNSAVTYVEPDPGLDWSLVITWSSQQTT